MRILRLSTLSLTLAIAVFSLGYVNPSFADRPNSDGCGEVHCGHGGGGGDPATVFDVAMNSTAVVNGKPGLLISADACGTTEDQGQELDVTLPDLCVTVNVNFIPPDGPPLSLEPLHST